MSFKGGGASPNAANYVQQSYTPPSILTRGLRPPTTPTTFNNLTPRRRF